MTSWGRKECGGERERERRHNGTAIAMIIIIRELEDFFCSAP